MVKKTSVRKVIRDERRPGPRSRGLRIVPSVESKGYTGHMDRENHGQEKRCRHPFTASLDKHYQAYALICVDQRNEISIHTSPDLKQHGDKVFDPEVCRIFLQCADMQELADQTGARDWSSKPHSLQHDLDQQPLNRRPSDRSLACRARSSRTAAPLSHKRKFLDALEESSPIGSNSESDPEDQNCENLDETQGSDREYRQIRIDDHQGLKAFFALRFGQIQHLMCRQIAGNWIRYIEPGKMVRYPYNGRLRSCRNQADVRIIGESDGELTKPPWWPKGVPHETPYHQKKHKRVMLLVHLLRSAHKHNKKATSSELKKVTDKMPLNSKQKIWLNDIYRVRHEEERLEAEAIQPGDTVLVEVSSMKPTKVRGPSKKRKRRDSTKAQAQARISRSDSVMSYNPNSGPQLESFDSGSLAGDTESPEQPQDRLCDNMAISSQANSALAWCRGDLNRPLRSLSLSHYAPGSTIENGGQESPHEAIASQDVYMETQTTIRAHDFEFVHSNPCPAITLREPEQMDNKRRRYQSLWPSQSPCMEYNGYAPSSAGQVYSDRSPSSYPSLTSQYPQNFLPSQCEHSPIFNESTHTSGLRRQQPSHGSQPSLAAPAFHSYDIEAYDPSNSCDTASFNQEHYGLPVASSCDYQIGPDHFHSK